MKPAALGLRAHSGWAALVVLAGSVDAPYPVRRSRIELIGKGTPKQPYHAAELLALAEAKQLIDHSISESRRLAAQALRQMAEELAQEGYQTAAGALLTSSARPLPELASVLASHALIHSAEGDLFREALAFGAQAWGIELRRIREKDLLTAAEAQLGRPGKQLQANIDKMRQEIGPPWAADQKLAALAAWIALGHFRPGRFSATSTREG